MPLRPGMPVSEAIHELTHYGSRPRSHRQIVAIAEANHNRKRGGSTKLFKAPISQPVVPTNKVLMHGLVSGGGTGRSDSLHYKVPKGGYVIPADVVSGIGHGNTASGARALEHTFPANLGRIQGRAHIRGETPLMHSPFATAFPNKKLADGGRNDLTDVLLSEGEFYLHPQALAQKFGSLKNGHKIMDHWVQSRRKETIRAMSKLKPPVGAKKQ